MNIVFSFDDGRDDAYQAYLILKKYNLTGSFHITTGFVDGSFSTDAFGLERKPLTIEQIQEMHRNGMDISSHGDKHITNTNDFVDSITKLKKFGIEKRHYGFSIPNSDYSKQELDLFVSNNEKHLLYVRVGRSKKCYSFFNKMNYVLYHTFHTQCFFNMFNKHNLLADINKYEINSLVVLSDTRKQSLIKFIDKYKNTSKMLVLMFHSIVPAVTNKWEYSITDFNEVCSYISNNCKVLTLEKLIAKM